MKKAEIETYYERGCGRCPSINVKVHQFGTELTAEKLHCDEATFEKAMGYAFESSQEMFWEEVQEIANYYLEEKGPFYKPNVYSAGRSGGHLIVSNLPDVETWDAIKVTAWGRFVKAIKSDIEWRCKAENILDDIESNEWNKPYSEKYNFLDTNKGSVCIADMKKQAIDAGFGPIVRR